MSPLILDSVAPAELETNLIKAFGELCPTSKVTVEADRSITFTDPGCACYCEHPAGCNLLRKLTQPGGKKITISWGTPAYDADDDTVTWGAYSKSTTSALAHELIHALHHAEGVLQKEWAEENCTSCAENQIRDELGVVRRSYYFNEDDPLKCGTLSHYGSKCTALNTSDELGCGCATLKEPCDPDAEESDPGEDGTDTGDDGTGTDDGTNDGSDDGTNDGSDDGTDDGAGTGGGEPQPPAGDDDDPSDPPPPPPPPDDPDPDCRCRTLGDVLRCWWQWLRRVLLIVWRALWIPVRTTANAVSRAFLGRDVIPDPPTPPPTCLDEFADLAARATVSSYRFQAANRLRCKARQALGLQPRIDRLVQASEAALLIESVGLRDQSYGMMLLSTGPLGARLLTNFQLGQAPLFVGEVTTPHEYLLGGDAGRRISAALRNRPLTTLTEHVGEAEGIYDGGTKFLTTWLDGTATRGALYGYLLPGFGPPVTGSDVDPEDAPTWEVMAAAIELWRFGMEQVGEQSPLS